MKTIEEHVRMNWFKIPKPKREPASTRDPDAVWIGPPSQGKSRAAPSLALVTRWAEQLSAPPAPGDGVDPFDAVRPADPHAKQVREVLAALLYAAQVAGVEAAQAEQWARTHSREPAEVLRPHAPNHPDARTAYLDLVYVHGLSEHTRTDILSRAAAVLKRAQHP